MPQFLSGVYIGRSTCAFVLCYRITGLQNPNADEGPTFSLFERALIDVVTISPEYLSKTILCAVALLMFGPDVGTPKYWTITHLSELKTTGLFPRGLPSLSYAKKPSSKSNSLRLGSPSPQAHASLMGSANAREVKGRRKLTSRQNRSATKSFRVTIELVIAYLRNHVFARST